MVLKKANVRITFPLTLTKKEARAQPTQLISSGGQGTLGNRAISNFGGKIEPEEGNIF